MNSTAKLDFFRGLMCLAKGLKEIFTDYRIFFYTLIPMLIGLLVISLGLYYGWDWSSELLKQQLTEYIGRWVSEKGYIFKIVFWLFNFIAKILFVILSIFIGFVVIQLVSIPLYTLSCERVLTKRNVFPKRDFKWGAWIRLTIRLFLISIFRMSIFMLVGLSVFILSFIPGLQFLAVIYSAYVMGLDCIDYTLEIYEMNLGRRFSIYFGNIYFFAGIGITLLPSLFIPGLTLLLLPIAVVGSSVCFAEVKGKEEYENLIA